MLPIDHKQSLENRDHRQKTMVYHRKQDFAYVHEKYKAFQAKTLVKKHEQARVARAELTAMVAEVHHEAVLIEKNDGCWIVFTPPFLSFLSKADEEKRQYENAMRAKKSVIKIFPSSCMMEKHDHALQESILNARTRREFERLKKQKYDGLTNQREAKIRNYVQYRCAFILELLWIFFCFVLKYLASSSNENQQKIAGKDSGRS